MTPAISKKAEPSINGIYRHFKGKLYRVIGRARHSETLEEMVVYQSLYGDQELWVRPAAMFFESVIANEVTQPRFVKIEDENP